MMQVEKYSIHSVNKFVVMTDMIGSRDKDRGKATEKAFLATRELNDRFSSDIFLPFKDYKGYDETGGILNTIEHCGPLVFDIAAAFHPYTTRIAVVYGPVHYRREKPDDPRWNAGGKNPIQTMGGEGFVRATDIMARLKSQDRLFELSCSNSLLDQSLSLNIEQMLHEMSNWSEIENSVVKFYRKLRNQNKVGEVLGITQQRVSKIFQQIEFRYFDYRETELNTIFHSYHNEFFSKK